MMTRLALRCALAVGLGLCASVLPAQPSHDQPEALLSVRGQPQSQELAQQAAALYLSASQDVARYEENLAGGRYKEGELREIQQIGKTAVKLTQLARLGEQLVILAEPAGVDIKLRSAALRLRLSEVIGKYRQVPKALEIISNTVVPAQNLVKQKRGAPLKRVGTNFQGGKVELAQKGLDEIFDEIEVFACWYTGSIGNDLYAPFGPARAVVDPKMLEIRQDAARQILEQLRNDSAPALDEALAQVQAAAAAIASAGKAEFQGQSLQGPDLLAAWGRAWRKLHAATIRTRAIDWARGQGKGVAPPSELDQLEAAWAALDKALPAAMADVIAADAARTAPDAAPALYVRYVQALGEIAPQLADPQALASAAGPALKQLANKSPELAVQVQAYEQATGELLRWRARAAAAHARRAARDARPVADVLTAAANDPQLQNRLRRASAKADVTWIGTPVPDTVRDLARLLASQHATVAGVSPREDGSGADRWRNRHFSLVAGARLPDAAVASLKADLLAAPAAPPLSLPAAIAIASAEQGCLAAAGGQITGIRADGLLVHLITLGDAPAHFPIGLLPEEGAAEAIQRLALAVELTPRWLQHEHAFAEVP